MIDIDIFEDSEMPSENGLSRLSKLYQRRAEKANEVDELRVRLKLAEEDLRSIDEDQFPKLFDEVGITSFEAGNRKISVKEKLYGSLPKDQQDRDAAIQEIVKLGGQAIIKTEIGLSFSKGEAERAAAIAKELREKGLDVDMKEGVHPMTFQAWARELLAKGTVLDMKKLGLYERRFIEVK